MILEDDRAVLMAENMPQVSENRTYQIWVIEGDVPRPSSLFEPQEEPIAAVVEDPLDEADAIARSEEHTSELQSRQYLVCRLLLEKQKRWLAGSLLRPEGVCDVHMDLVS